MARSKPAAQAPPRPELLSLLRACKEAPEDEGPRLILADWLEEHGDPHDTARAEFIRVQCRLAHLPARDPGRAELKRRVEALRTEHSAIWLGLLAGKGRKLSFQRGLIHVKAPRCWHVSGPAWADCAVSEPFAWLEGISTEVLSPHSARQFAQGPFLAGLSLLRVERSGLTAPIAQALFESPPPPSLRTLVLRGCRFSPAGAAALADSPWLASLTTLDVSLNRVASPGVARLLASPRLAGLRTLDLSGNTLGLPGVQALADSPHTGSLTSLALAHNRLGTPGAARLAQARLLGQLTHLDLTACNIPAAGLAALAGSPRAARLNSLLLSANYVADKGVQALAESPHLGKLRTLHLGYAGITDTGATALAEAASLPGLVRLKLGGNQLGKAARRALRKRFGAGVTFWDLSL
jgi:uncharacterized protein (TIGR02996 family)